MDGTAVQHKGRNFISVTQLTAPGDSHATPNRAIHPQGGRMKEGQLKVQIFYGKYEWALPLQKSPWELLEYSRAFKISLVQLSNHKG